tara:strand:- start:72 stop:533 length:462 start_codon:yes stop_codon:yes gene_type:complete
MAIINSYPTITAKAGDLVLISDTSTEGNPTKTATASSIANLGPSGIAGTNAYIASWTQSSTSDPVPVEIYNNTGATFTWARVSQGQYSITASSNVFTTNKTFYNLQGSGTLASSQIVQPTSISNSVAIFRGLDVNTGALQDGNKGWVEIRIYN